MNLTYTEINVDLLSAFPARERRHIKRLLVAAIRDRERDDNHIQSIPPGIPLDRYLRKSGRRFFFGFCPYCNQTMFLSTSKAGTRRLQPSVCVFCGETNPADKIEANLVKTEYMRDLISLCDKSSETSEGLIRRVLLEQSIVMVATGLEVFLRDIYSVTLNIRFVRRGLSLTDRFYEDSRNDFTNIGKIESILRNDLGVDLKEVLTERMLARLELAVFKRHVIVHNAGVVDDIFLEQIRRKRIVEFLDTLHQRPKPESPVPVSAREIDLYVSASRLLVKKIVRIFEREFRPMVLEEIRSFPESLPSWREVERRGEH